MSRVTATRVISTPVEAVWQVFADLAGRRTWLSEVESVELLTAPSAELAIGTAWRETRVDRGHTLTEDLVIVAVEPGRSCTLGLLGNPSSPRMCYVFTPVAVGSHRGGTTMQLIVESEPQPARRSQRIANRLLAFLVGGFAARTAEGALRDELDSLALACAEHAAARPRTSAA